MAYLLSFIKSSFIFATLLVLRLPKKWFALKIILFIYSLPYFIAVLIRKKIQKKSMLIICIEDFGIALIKLGQFLATRSDIVSEDILLEELPVATASIAQVYKGKIVSLNETVAVKILKPKIIKEIEVQTKIIYFFGLLINLFSKNFRKLCFLDIIVQISKDLKNETNLLNEAAATDKFYKTMQCQNIIIPKVYWLFSNEKVLVMEWIDGVILNKANALDSCSQKELESMANSLLICYLIQFYDDGVFHADPHQGNIMITSDKKIAILDFGRVGFINDKEKEFLIETLYGFITFDYKKVALAHLKAGYIARDTNLLDFELSCLIIGRQFIGKKSSKINIASSFEQIIKVALKFGMRSQKSLFLFNKTVAMLEGTLMTINSEIDPWTVSEPWITEKIKQQYRPKAIFNATKNKIINFIKTL